MGGPTQPVPRVFRHTAHRAPAHRRRRVTILSWAFLLAIHPSSAFNSADPGTLLSVLPGAFRLEGGPKRPMVAENQSIAWKPPPHRSLCPAAAHRGNRFGLWGVSLL